VPIPLSTTIYRRK